MDVNCISLSSRGKSTSSTYVIYSAIKRNEVSYEYSTQTKKPYNTFDEKMNLIFLLTKFIGNNGIILIMYSILCLITANFQEKIKSEYCAYTFFTGKLLACFKAFKS